MKAIVEYDKDDVIQLIARDVLAKFGVKVDAKKQITLTVSKHDGSIVFEVDMKNGREMRNV